MPLFEYRCQGCSKVFEVFTQRREPGGAPTCPECGKTEVERVLSSFAGKVVEGGGCGTASGHG